MDEQGLHALLREIVAIDSVNPSLVPGARGEAEIASYLREFLRGHGIAAGLEEVAPGRPNVVAFVGGDAALAAGAKPAVAGRAATAAKPRAALAVLAHLDTVGAGDMKDPLTPREQSGQLYGRGALDIKSGVAAMCAAALALDREHPRLARPLLIAGVVDEEYNSAGTEALLERYTADAAIVLEPTNLAVCVAHKGYAWFEVTTRGQIGRAHV